MTRRRQVRDRAGGFGACEVRAPSIHRDRKAMVRMRERIVRPGSALRGSVEGATWCGYGDGRDTGKCARYPITPSPAGAGGGR